MADVNGTFYRQWNEKSLPTFSYPKAIDLFPEKRKPLYIYFQFEYFPSYSLTLPPSFLAVLLFSPSIHWRKFVFNSFHPEESSASPAFSLSPFLTLSPSFSLFLSFSLSVCICFSPLSLPRLHVSLPTSLYVFCRYRSQPVLIRS